RLHELFDDELLAIVATGHPWAGRPYIDAAAFDQAHLVLFDSYDPARTPSAAPPIPQGGRPAAITYVPLVTDLLIESILGTDKVATAPSWTVAAPPAAGRVAGVQTGSRPHSRTWYAATRRGVQPAPIRDFVDQLRRYLSETTVGAA